MKTLDELRNTVFSLLNLQILLGRRCRGCPGSPRPRTRHWPHCTSSSCSWSSWLGWTWRDICTRLSSSRPRPPLPALLVVEDGVVEAGPSTSSTTWPWSAGFLVWASRQASHSRYSPWHLCVAWMVFFSSSQDEQRRIWKRWASAWICRRNKLLSVLGSALDLTFPRGFLSL